MRNYGQKKGMRELAHQKNEVRRNNNNNYCNKIKLKKKPLFIFITISKL